MSDTLLDLELHLKALFTSRAAITTNFSAICIEVLFIGRDVLWDLDIGDLEVVGVISRGMSSEEQTMRVEVLVRPAGIY